LQALEAHIGAFKSSKEAVMVWSLLIWCSNNLYFSKR
jgi:hypothetical protein